MGALSRAFTAGKWSPRALRDFSELAKGSSGIPAQSSLQHQSSLQQLSPPPNFPVLPSQRTREHFSLPCIADTTQKLIPCNAWPRFFTSLGLPGHGFARSWAGFRTRQLWVIRHSTGCKIFASCWCSEMSLLFAEIKLPSPTSQNTVLKYVNRIPYMPCV